MPQLTVAQGVMLGVTAVGMYLGNKASKRMTAAANAQTQAQLQLQREAMARLEKQKAIYKEMEFFNPYADVQNYYEGLENTMEDLTVNTQAADFAMERGDQQRANILNNLRGAAGGSGISALAQTLANQGVLQAAQVSAQIAQQERQNQLAQAQSANQLQFAEAQGMSAADMARRGGEAMVQQAEMSRQSTLLGIEYSGMAGANQGVQAAYANQMSAQMAGLQMQMNNFKTLMNTGTSLYEAGAFDG
tara:strand:- start:2240 stop:2980 length:741 start_codon:yes stop_codon:yes gene_type:complete